MPGTRPEPIVGVRRKPTRAGRKPPPGGGAAPPAGEVDLPAGTMVYRMSRTDFDVRCDEDFWKRGDYDARRGLAEVVETPLLGHEWRGIEVTALVLAVFGDRVRGTGALRIEWRGSILEPDASFYFAPHLGGGHGDDENCRPELGHRPPALVVEINRSTGPARAAEKRGDYFDMGVREVWTWRPKDGAAIYRRAEGGPPLSAAASVVAPGITREDLARLWEDHAPEETFRRRVEVASRVRRRRNAGRAASAPVEEP